MPWQMYRWVWRLESPLHVGISPAGVLNRTRLYIPARALWGAFTAELSRRQCANFPDYQSKGEELLRKSRFTYLFPAERVGSEWKAWLPFYKDGRGLVWKRDDREVELDDRSFRTRLLSTRPSTAIQPASDTAEEGTLREMEYIQPRWCTDDGKAGGEVAFVGYVFFQDEALCKEVQEITELLIGADTRYGFGHLRRIQWKQPKDCFGKRVNLDSKNPLIESRYLLGHLLATDPTFKGALEVLQQWDKEQAHVVGLTWVPGSRVRDDKINIFEILPSGLWERLRNRANHGKGSLRPEQNQARPFNGEGMATWVRR